MKKYILLVTIFFMTIISVNILFILNTINLPEVMALSPNINFYQDKQVLKNFTNFDEVDKTIFVFTYGKRVWRYNAVNHLEKSMQFDLNQRKIKYINNNNKKEKIVLINKLKKLKIENKIIIEYIFPNLLNKLSLIKNNIEKPSKNAQIKADKLNNKITIIKELIGIKLNENLLYDNILNNYQVNNEIYIEIPYQYVTPEVTANLLKNYTNFRAKFSTSFSNSTGDRKHNIKQAAKKIDGTILTPGETFSFNKIVGKRTLENGFRTAKIIYNGTYIDGVGGGVCQVSSTLYNAVLKAGLKVEQSSKHSEKVNYVNSGFDAMVNYGTSDLVFKNTTNQNVYILAFCKDNKINISIFGASLNGYEYKLRSEVLDVIPCKAEEVLIDKKLEYTDKILYSDESFYLKKAKEGCTVKSYRDTYCYGKLVKTEIIRIDKYRPQHAVRIVGSKVRPTGYENVENEKVI